ncbi:MAG: hypothetical protein WC549_02055 [Actinomycetota bacterium]
MEPKIFTHLDVRAELDAEAKLMQTKSLNFSQIMVLPDSSRTTENALLQTLGFRNSIASKLYDAFDNDMIKRIAKEVETVYHGTVRFITVPQLERICEKYNLFVRNTEFYFGDIPEKNIQDMANFCVYPHICFGTMSEEVIDRIERSLNIRVNPKSYSISLFRFCNIINFKLQIAAVKEMFMEDAFKESDKRILLKNAEPLPTGKVMKDPIVLFPVLTGGEYSAVTLGYIIITAWGPEANDSLVANPNKN